MDKIDIIRDYIRKIKASNKELTKKEAFKDLLNRLYHHSDDVLNTIDQMSLGAERSVLNIEYEDRSKRGSADTYFNRVIIEFENDLRKTEKHAIEQLSEYLSGVYNSGDGYNFILIASDFITWKVYAPSIESFHDDILKVENVNLELKVDESFTLSDKNAEEFYFYIDRILFREVDRKASLENFKIDFGVGSQVYIESIRQLKQYFNEAKKYGKVKVAYNQWKRFLSVAYGSFESSEDKYLIHTYLSIFSKMLAYSVLKADKIIEDSDIKAIIEGQIFDQLNVRNFIDHDFYYWVALDLNFDKLKKTFRKIAQQISTYDFTDVDEDILKGVYQDLIDLDTRHSLGEYYTPDWLCEKIVDQFTFKPSDKILDPACGSGSFLRAIAHSLLNDGRRRGIREINDQLYGIDIHPLSVQIAKTTLLIAYGNKVLKSEKPVYLHVYLSNAVLLPEDETIGGKSLELLGKTFKVSINAQKYVLNEKIFENPDVFDVAINLADKLAEDTKHNKAEEAEIFSRVIERKTGKTLNKQLAKDFHSIYKAFKKAKETDKNGIWKFIVQNLYRPFFHKKKFDYVIGNPPWFTYNSIKSEEYQDDLNALAVRYRVKPKKIANYPHLEIAAIFLAHSTAYFLKEHGKVAFVLPRSFFSSDHHNETRSGKAAYLKIIKLWDLDRVSPLFRVPACVIFGESLFGVHKPPDTGIPGLIWKGRPKDHNANWKNVKDIITQTETKFYYSKLGNSTAFTPTKLPDSKGYSYYHNYFRNGATIIPRNFYFVDILNELPDSLTGKEIAIKTSETSKREAKKPWDMVNFKGLMEGEQFFYTTLSKNILPFTHHGLALIVLPVTKSNNDRHITLQTWGDLRSEGLIEAGKWFRNVSNVWNQLKTKKNKKKSANEYLNWQNKLTQQPLDAPFLVLYNSSAKDANAVVIKRSEISLEFVVDSTAYWFATYSEYEAYYLLSMINSNTANELIKYFQARGLFGARHVSKKILDVPFPKFDKYNEVHLELSKLGVTCESKAREWIVSTNSGEMTGVALGKARLEIKKHLTKEMREIDRLVNKIVLQKDEMVAR